MVKKKIIMVVDDEYVIAESIRETLEKEGGGYELITALSGKEALSRLRKSEIDLILVDVMMPDMNGFELVEKIRADKKIKDVKIAFLTILTLSNKQMKDLKRLKVLDYIQKPYRNKDLVKRIKKILDK
jgi:CheY-like chemotaxis protein